VVNSLSGSAEVKRVKNSGYIGVGRMVDLIKGANFAKESYFR